MKLSWIKSNSKNNLDLREYKSIYKPVITDSTVYINEGELVHRDREW